MKKILPRLLLVALPFLLYFALFFAFEPYDYFGLKGGAAQEDSVITRVRSYLSAPENAIILGDSRMAHFDMDAVESASGRAFSNLAFGGASLGESIDLFYLAAQNNPNLDACYFGVSFYTLREGDTRNRMQAIEKVATNPAAYMLNFNYNVDMLGELSQRLRGIETGATRDEGRWTDADFVDENGEKLPHRSNLIAYAATLYQNCAKPGTLPAIETEPYLDQNGKERARCLNPRELLNAFARVTPADSTYKTNKENLQKLAQLADYCQKNDIALTFVLPPVDDALRDYLLAPLGIDKELIAVKTALAATGAAVRDFECEPEAVFAEEQYYDGFHLDVVNGLPEFTAILFGGKE